MPASTTPGLLDGLALPLEGARLLARERRLWAPALVPFVISFIAFGLAIAGIVAGAGELHVFATGWMPALEATAWYEWIWIGPAWLGLRVLGAAIFLLLAAVILVAAFLLASLLASPFHDALARRAEEVVAGTVQDVTGSGVVGTLREAGRALRGEALRLLFYLAVVGPLALIGLLVPGAQLVTGPVIVAVTLLFLPLDYASYTLDRRHIEFGRKRRWVLDHIPLMTGFGATAFAVCLVPGLNFAAMPALVVGGTLLALRAGPDAPELAPDARPVGRPPAPGPGTSTSP